MQRAISTTIRATAPVIALVVALSGCSQKGLMDLRHNGEGPDEFLILPANKLEMPADFSTLPPPTPGGANRTDRAPVAEGIAALGGRQGSPTDAIPAQDAALVNASRRYGTDPAIRTTLAEADAEFRRTQARGTRIRLFPVDRYSQAYRRDKIDPFAQTEAVRRAGGTTPTSPPVN